MLGDPYVVSLATLGPMKGQEKVGTEQPTQVSSSLLHHVGCCSQKKCIALHLELQANVVNGREKSDLNGWNFPYRWQL